MSMIRTVSYKASIQADGSIYNESIEFGAEVDSMPLAQSQLDDANARVDQLRQAILGQRKQWEQGPAPTPDQPKDQKPAGQNTLDGKAPTKSMDLSAYDRNKPGWVRCPKCGKTDITHDHKAPKTGTWQGCTACGIFLNADGTTVNMKPRGD
jgi:hypothetical protein